jgi:CheY-like chemotaxis protein
VLVSSYDYRLVALSVLIAILSDCRRPPELARPAASQAGPRRRRIVIDERMPAMNGFALVEAMRQRPDVATATLMMLTAANHRRDVARCRGLGIVAYVSKPVRQGELHEAIARLLVPALVRT